MPDLIQDIDEILDSFPDNNARDITAQELRNYVVSISVFGSLSRDTIGAQMVDAAPEVLEWDGVGVLRGVAQGVANDLEIPVGGDGDYEVLFTASVDSQNTRIYDISVAVNGAPVNTLSWVEGDGNIKAAAGAIVKNLLEGDLVSIWCEASGAASSFFMQVGSQFSIKRLL